MLKTSIYIYLLLILIFALLSTVPACSYFPTTEQGGKTTSATVSIDVQTLSQAQSKTLRKFIGTINDIASITVDVFRGTTPLITAQQLTYSNGVWSGTLQNLPIGPSLTFIGHAYNTSAVQIFTGTTVQTMTGTNDAVSILMAPVTDGVPAMFPKIARITVPAEIVTASTVSISISVEASSGETLTYATTAAPVGGIFSPSGGTITISAPGTTGTIVLSYAAPATAGTYTHSIRLTNSQTNWVETDFSTVVVTATTSASLSVQFSPVITAIGAKRSGSNVTFTAAVSDTTPTTLTYSWGFDGGLTFADNTTNPAVLQGYDETRSGNLTLTVTNGVGGATTVSYSIAPGLLPDIVVVSTGSGFVINEVDYDNIGSDTAEYIELYNGGTSALNLAGYQIVMVNGATSTVYTTVDLGPAGIMQPGQYLVVGSDAALAGVAAGALTISLGSSINYVQNGAPDGLALVNTNNNTLVDALSYEGSITAAAIAGLGTVSLVEGTVLPLSVADSDTLVGSLCRLPNGSDTNDAAADWKFCTTLTPGAANVP